MATNTYIIRKYVQFALDHGGFDDEHNEQARRVLEDMERLTVEPRDNLLEQIGFRALLDEQARRKGSSGG